MSNRSTLLQCALALFATRGYNAIGVQEIADAAGVTKPTLYHYFGNKRGLLEALVQESFAPLLAELATAARYERDLTLTLERVVEVYFRFAHGAPLLYRMQLAMWFTLPENEAHQVVATVTEAQQRLLEQLFEAAAQQHGNMRGRQRIYAATLLGTVNTYIALALAGHAALDQASAHRAVQQFSYGIYS